MASAPSRSGHITGPRPVLILQNTAYARDRAVGALGFTRQLGCTLAPVATSSWSEVLDRARKIEGPFVVADPFFSHGEAPDLQPLQELSALRTKPRLLLYYDPRGRPHPELLPLPRVEYGATLRQARDDVDEAFLRAFGLAARHQWRSEVWEALERELTPAALSELGTAVRASIRESGHTTLDGVTGQGGPDRRVAGERCARGGLRPPKTVLDAFHGSLMRAMAVEGCFPKGAIQAALGYRTLAPITRFEGLLASGGTGNEAFSPDSVEFWVAMIRAPRPRHSDEGGGSG